AKHYVRDEVLEAYQTFRKGFPAQRGVIKDQRGEWMTGEAAFRFHGCRHKKLARWQANGWLETMERPRSGSGRYSSTTYFRVDGERGFLGPKAFQTGPQGHVVWPQREADPKQPTTPPNAAAADSPAEAPAPPPRGRGRPKGRTQNVLDRITKLLESWDRREFGDNKAATAAAYGFNRSD